MTTEKEQLEAEIAKRDARIAELERQGAALAASYCDGVIGDSYGHAYCKYKAELAALKARQPSACVIGGTGISSSMRGALAEAGQQPASGGAYSRDPLACSGCAAGCFRCRSSAGVVLPERMVVPGPLWKDARQPYGNPLNASDISAAESFNLAIDEVARLNPCRAQAVVDGWVMVPVNSTEAMRDAIDLLCDDSAAFDDSEAFWRYLIAAATSANSEQARACVTCNGVGIIGHSTLCPECADAQPAEKESDDE